jgi:hypothetical protein
VESTSFPARSARYVRIQGIDRATPYGISLWDARVFGPADGPPAPDVGEELPGAPGDGSAPPAPTSPPPAPTSPPPATVPVSRPPAPSTRPAGSRVLRRTSVRINLSPSPRIARAAGLRARRLRRAVLLRGLVAPAAQGYVRISLERRRGGRWVQIRRATVRVGRDSSFRRLIKNLRAGRYRVRATYLGSARAMRSVSPAVGFRIR